VKGHSWLHSVSLSQDMQAVTDHFRLQLGNVCYVGWKGYVGNPSGGAVQDSALVQTRILSFEICFFMAEQCSGKGSQFRFRPGP
jgi:hypothetical protein